MYVTLYATRTSLGLTRGGVNTLGKTKIRAATRKNNGGRRSDLTAKELFLSALQLIDEEGIEALTMRRLASELGVSAMTLYRHVRSRDELLDGVTQLLCEETDLSTRPGEPRAEAVRRMTRTYRGVAQRHPNAYRLLALSPVTRPPVLNQLVRLLRAFEAAGYSESEALVVFTISDAFATGFSLTEAEELKRRAGLAKLGKPIGGYEGLVAADVARMISQVTSDELFEHGLSIILDALEGDHQSALGTGMAPAGPHDGAVPGHGGRESPSGDNDRRTGGQPLHLPIGEQPPGRSLVRRGLVERIEDPADRRRALPPAPRPAKHNSRNSGTGISRF